MNFKFLWRNFQVSVCSKLIFSRIPTAASPFKGLKDDIRSHDRAVMMLHLPLCARPHKTLSPLSQPSFALCDPFIYTQKCWKAAPFPWPSPRSRKQRKQGLRNKARSQHLGLSRNSLLLNSKWSCCIIAAACVTTISTLRTRIFHIFLSLARASAVIDRCLCKIKHPSSTYVRVWVS